MTNRFRKTAFALMTVLLLSVLMFSSSCDLGGDAYFVSFSVDGTAYNLTSGYDGNVMDNGANGCYSSSQTQIQITAAGDNVTNTTSANCEGPILIIHIGGAVPGTYSGSDFGFAFFTGSEDININTDHPATSGSLTIIEVGDVIRGSFSATTSVPDEPTVPDKVISSGVFQVERVADDSLDSPGYFS